MKEKDKLTQKIFDMYQQYPFPDIDYKMDYSLPLIRFFVKHAPKGKKNLLEDAKIMDTLMDSCIKLKNEIWFDDLAAALLLEFLAEIAEADHIIEETEIQFLKNIADVFGVKPPKI